MLAEMRRRSVHEAGIERDLTRHVQELSVKAEEVRRFCPAKMEEACAFMETLERKLNVLEDERAVLRRVEGWPEAKVDTMREACALFRELTAMKDTCKGYKPRRGGKPAEDLAKVVETLEKTQRRIESLQRSEAADAQRFREHSLPWTPEFLSGARFSTLGLALAHMRLSVDEARRLQAREPDSQQKRKELLGDSVRVAFRTHQFTGGFNAECSAAFEDVRAELAKASGTPRR